MIPRASLAACLLAVAVAFSAGCSHSPDYESVPLGEELPIGKTSFSFDQDKAPFDIFKEYRIAPGDMLDILFQIRTWVKRDDFKLAIDHTVDVKFVNTPAFNQVQRVRPDGTISLPYLGSVYVLDKTVEDLTGELKSRYASILRDPEIFVTVPDFRSAIRELKADLMTAPRGLSRLVTVRPDGYVTFPLVGDMKVSDRTFADVREELNDRYEDYLPGLNCDLFLEKHSGMVIYLAGEVLKPGRYTITRPMSIMEAMGLAGSHTPNARLDSVFVIRKHEEKLVATRVDVRGQLDFTDPSDFFYLLPDDVVFVPKTKIAESAEIANQIADILFFRGWSVGLSWELRDVRER